MSLNVPAKYRALDLAGVLAYSAGIEAIANRVGGDASGWQVREVGDGNMNLVFLLAGVSGSCIIKQAVPYVRVIGESWPLKLERNLFEYQCLLRQARYVPSLVPEIYYHDQQMALMAMEYLTPHVILRKELINGKILPRVAQHMAEYMSQTLFKTSDLYMKYEQKRADLRLFSKNSELTETTEDVVFTGPYLASDLNRWTSPELDQTVADLRNDKKLKQAAQHLKFRFATCAEALLHGDLHTGSVMVTDRETKVIDPEFAFYGPMGFDMGAFQANWLLAYFSQRGHEKVVGERKEYQQWILQQMQAIWHLFEVKFRMLWQKERQGTAFSGSLFNATTKDTTKDNAKDNATTKDNDAALQGFLQQLLQDAIGFAGAKMVRRLIGISHVEDMESIQNQVLRASCEKKALQLARQMMLESTSFTSRTSLISGFEEVCQRAEAIEQSP